MVFFSPGGAAVNSPGRQPRVSDGPTNHTEPRRGDSGRGPDTVAPPGLVRLVASAVPGAGAPGY
jgi:hypothetical protein